MYAGRGGPAEQRQKCYGRARGRGDGQRRSGSWRGTRGSAGRSEQGRSLQLAREECERDGMAVGRGRRGGSGRGARGRGSDGSETKRPGKGSKRKKAKVHTTTYSLSGGERVGSVLVTDRVGKREAEREKEDEEEGRDGEADEVSSAESRDSRTERLERFLTANLNLDSDPDDEDDGFVFGGCGTGTDDLSDDEYPLFTCVSRPAATHLSPSIVRPGVLGEREEEVTMGKTAGVSGEREEEVTMGKTAGVLGEREEEVTMGKTAGVSGEREEEVTMGKTAGVSGEREEEVTMGKTAGNGELKSRGMCGFVLAGQEDDYDLDQFGDVPDQVEDAPNPFEDADELIKRGTGGICVVQAAGKVERKPQGGSGFVGVMEREGEEDSDGWISDSSQFAANFQGDSVPDTSKLPPYAMYEDDVWVDEAKAIFSKKESTKEFQDLLHEMFDIHTDVYSLLLAFVRRAGKTRHQPKSLPRITLASFQKWLKEGDKVEEEGATQMSLPVLRDEHKEGVLELMTRSHLILMEDLCAVFELHTAKKDLLINLVHDTLAENRRKEAVTYAWTFHLQRHFRLDDMLLPLIALDKINLIEHYIEDDRGLQEEFLMLLDKLCHSEGRLASYTKGLGLEGNTPNSKLSTKQLFKLALRLVKMFDLDLNKFTGLASQRRAMCLHHLLRQRYTEGNITDSNMEDLIAAAISSCPGLQHQLVRELLRLGDTTAAAHWAIKYHVPTNTLPLDVQFRIMDQLSSSPARTMNADLQSGKRRGERDEGGVEYLQLSLPLNCVHFVNSVDSLRRCRCRLAQKGAIIGVDAEWRLPICNGGKERMAVMQLAVNDAVYLLDMLALPQCLSKSELRNFIQYIFANNSTTKLGYSIEGDLDLLIRSWPFAADIIGSPARVVDIKTLAAMVDKLQKQVQTPSSELPQHPLVVQNFSGRPHQLSQPPTRNPSNHSTCPMEPRPTTPRGSPAADFYDPLSLEDSLETGLHRGLSLLTQRELGKPLDKSEQMSDWERRPLKPEQVQYAALDAVCLLQLYTVLATRAHSLDPNFNTEPAIPPPRIRKERSFHHRKQ